MDTGKPERMTFTLHPYLNAVKEASKRAIKYFVERNYTLAKTHYKYRLHRGRMQYKKPPLLIYQMGKVGSIAVRTSLTALPLDMPIYHVHFLRRDRVAEIEKSRKKYFRTEKHHSIEIPWLWQYLREQIEARFNGKKWKIITLVRDPIARNISTFFENLKINPRGSHDSYEIESDFYNIEPTVVKLSDLGELTKFFFGRLNHDVPLIFFDREMKSVFGIDVFATEFPKSKGYKIYEEQKADVLLIRLDNLTECASIAFKEFLNIENLTLLNSNIGDKKDYALVYQRFKDSITLPEAYIDKMYRSKYMRHFYTDKEICRFRARWSRSGL